MGREPVGPLLAVVEAAAAEMRGVRSPNAGHYLVLPRWMIQLGGGGWDAFAEEFERSMDRQPDLIHRGVRGFECEWAGVAYQGRPAMRRYTLRRYREEAE